MKTRTVFKLSSHHVDPSLAKEILGFEATKTLTDMCRDAMNWQTKNPNGYDD